MSKHSTRHTFTYKTKPVDILCDVHLPDETKYGVVAHLSRQILASAGGKTFDQVDHKLPLLVYWHGGGLTAGNRRGWKPTWLFDDALDAGFIVVSADYRLLTPPTAHVVVEDAVDLIKWIHEHLNDHLARISSQLADLTRIAVSGSSAGGYVAYQACLHAEPKPQVLASIYPAGGDLLLDHWCTPKMEPWYKNQPLFTDADEAKFESILSSTEDQTVTTSRTDSSDPRPDYTFWLMEKGRFLDILTGEPGLGQSLRALSYEERAKSIPQGARITFPQFGIQEVESFPPTIFVHGSQDGAVLIEETRIVVETLRKKGTKVELLEFEGKDHAFDLEPTLEKEVKEQLNRVVPFLQKYLK